MQLTESDLLALDALRSRYGELFHQKIEIARTSRLGLNDPDVIRITEHLQELENGIRSFDCSTPINT